MSDKDDLRKQIYESMQLKTTEELQEIWQQNDREEWSDVSFGVVEEILKQRTGQAPLRSSDDAMDVTESEQDTYYDFGGVEKIASLADIVAWVVLVGNIVEWILDIYQNNFLGSFPSIQSFIVDVATTGLQRILGGVYLFVILKAIAQGIYILIDVEENTHTLSKFARSNSKEER